MKIWDGVKKMAVLGVLFRWLGVIEMSLVGSNRRPSYYCTMTNLRAQGYTNSVINMAELFCNFIVLCTTIVENVMTGVVKIIRLA